MIDEKTADPEVFKLFKFEVTNRSRSVIIKAWNYIAATTVLMIQYLLFLCSVSFQDVDHGSPQLPIALNNICLFIIFPARCSTINTRKLVKQVTY